jgi:hypothetical protein
MRRNEIDRAIANAEGHACLANLAQGTVYKILDQEEVKPNKVRDLRP